MMRNFSFLILLFIAIPLNIIGQQMIIRSVSLQPSDKTAILQPCLISGDTCALLKIKTDNLEGIEFSNPNQYVKTSYIDGYYYVYLPSNIGRRLDFLHKDYMPVHLDMADFGYKKLRQGRTYLVVLDAPKKTDLKSSVILKIEPKDAIVMFDNQRKESSGNGTYEIPVTAGSYSYSVEAENYQSKEGSVSVGKSEAKTISVRLIPITREVLVGSNVDKARVFVDNIDYGRVGKIVIPQGKHIVRVQADGYVDVEKTVLVNESTAPLSFILEENVRATHIHATPVTIYAPSSPYVYKNGKKIKEWSNGATILFMPGKYMLSTFERGNEKEIVVGSEPMTVNL